MPPQAEGAPGTAGDEQASRANVAAGLAVLAVAVFAAFAAADADGPIWLLQGATALAAATTGWLAGGGTMPRGRALAALVVGVVLFAMFVVGTITNA